MRARIAAAAVLAGLLALSGCAKSQEEIANDCTAAVKDWKGPLHVDKERPSECEGLNEDDYSLIILHEGLTRDGLFDENGDVNMDKLLED